MKICIKNFSWGSNNEIILDWNLNYLPHVGENLDLTSLLSEEQKEELEKIDSSLWGYEDGRYSNLYDALDSDMNYDIDHIRWYKDHEGEICILLHIS